MSKPSIIHLELMPYRFNRILNNIESLPVPVEETYVIIWYPKSMSISFKVNVYGCENECTSVRVSNPGVVN